VPVLALFDRDAAHEATLRNLLQRKGFEGLEDVEAKARSQGEATGEAKGEAKALANAILAVLAARKLAVTPPERRAIQSTRDRATLTRWIRRAATATSTRAVLTPVRRGRSKKR
jgi:hypothetical protein